MSTFDRKSDSATQSTGGGAAIDFEAEHRPDGAMRASAMLLRRHIQKRANAAASKEETHAAAERGVTSPRTSLPFAEQIQASFGPAHDVSQIRAHVGGDSASAMGATAFATGNDVVFDRSPDLHTAAHEAAHVVQQAHGVNLYGGVGEAGDSYERHADAVADRVVAGQSAADLLGQTGGGSSTKAVQKDTPKVVDNQPPVVDLAGMQSHARRGTQDALEAAVNVAAKRISDAAVVVARSMTTDPNATAQLEIVREQINTLFLPFGPAVFEALPAPGAVAMALEHVVGALARFSDAWVAVGGTTSATNPIRNDLEAMTGRFGMTYATIAARWKGEGAIKGNDDKLTESAVRSNADSFTDLVKLLDKTSSEDEARGIVFRARANISELHSLFRASPSLTKTHKALLAQVAADANMIHAFSSRYPGLKGLVDSVLEHAQSIRDLHK